jgi:hypothetical protein
LNGARLTSSLIFFLLCLVYSFSWLNQNEREYSIASYRFFITHSVMIAFVYFRERTREEEDRKEHRRQYLFLNTHHCAMVEKQEKKKIPVLTVNSSNSIFKPWQLRCYHHCWCYWFNEGWLIIVIFYVCICIKIV